MKFSDTMKTKAISLQRTLVLPETDPRVLEAACILVKEHIAKKVILLGDKDSTIEFARANHITLPENGDIEIINPVSDERREHYATQYYEKRQAKGLSKEKAFQEMSNPLYFGTMMVAQHDCYAMVAGAITTTADVLRSAIRIIGTKSDTPLVSSCFVMESEHKHLGHEGLMIFSDCAIIPRPTAEQLVYITLGAAASCQDYLNVVPCVAMLSFSTKGSASHEEVERVQTAVHTLNTDYPELIVDGELQMDASVHKKTGALKAPHSPVAGNANVLIFPDLACGNIAYKTAQQFGNARAYGPFIQGLSAPVSDLSRGCTTEEIVTSAAVTLCQERKQ